MLNDNAKKWVAALRSGDYYQTDNTLTKLPKGDDPIRHCCLGVACDLYKQEHPDFPTVDEGSYRSYSVSPEDYDPIHNHGDDAVLPLVVQQWLGLNTDLGSFRDEDENNSLTSLNDAGVTFEGIADVIESEPEGLFA